MMKQLNTLNIHCIRYVNIPGINTRTNMTKKEQHILYNILKVQGFEEQFQDLCMYMCTSVF